MNLHELKFEGAAQWLWLYIRGGNGRSIGTHLWLLEEGEPPAMEDAPDNNTINARWWQPARYSWRPFKVAMENLFGIRGTHLRWIRPLCGKTSAARWPEATTAYDHYDNCRDCTRIAREHGIIGLYERQIIENNPTYTLIQGEYLAWQQAREVARVAQEIAQVTLVREAERTRANRTANLVWPNTTNGT